MGEWAAVKVQMNTDEQGVFPIPVMRSVVYSALRAFAASTSASSSPSVLRSKRTSTSWGSSTFCPENTGATPSKRAYCGRKRERTKEVHSGPRMRAARYRRASLVGSASLVASVVADPAQPQKKLSN